MGSTGSRYRSPSDVTYPLDYVSLLSTHASPRKNHPAVCAATAIPRRDPVDCRTMRDIAKAEPLRQPMQHYAAITPRFEASRRKPASTYAHGKTTWQH